MGCICIKDSNAVHDHLQLQHNQVIDKNEQGPVVALSEQGLPSTGYSHHRATTGRGHRFSVPATAVVTTPSDDSVAPHRVGSSQKYRNGSASSLADVADFLQAQGDAFSGSGAAPLALLEHIERTTSVTISNDDSSSSGGALRNANWSTCRTEGSLTNDEELHAKRRRGDGREE